MPAIRRRFFGMMTSSRSYLVRSVIALAAGLALLAGTAARAQENAATTGFPGFPNLLLATGGVYGGPAQANAFCYVFNAGTVTQHIAIGIRDQTGGFVGPLTTVQSRKGTISAAAGAIANNVAYSCTVLGATGTSATNLRGVMDIRDVNSNVLINSNLR
jgi:hypothetical protein